MKIEAVKNLQIENKESKNVYKTESSVFNSPNTLKPAEIAPPPTSGAFAKILEESRKENGKNNAAAAKNADGEHDAKAARSEKDEKVNRQTDEKKKLDERDGKKGDSDARQNDDENQASAALALNALQQQKNSTAENSAPPARSILHVADLERIISTIRTETFQNQKQVTIALKNSILEGLQIRLTIDENGKLKAEFLALNEQIKKQLNSRKKELSSILTNRSTLFAEVEVKGQTPKENG